MWERRRELASKAAVFCRLPTGTQLLVVDNCPAASFTGLFECVLLCIVWLLATSEPVRAVYQVHAMFRPSMTGKVPPDRLAYSRRANSRIRKGRPWQNLTFFSSCLTRRSIQLSTVNVLFIRHNILVLGVEERQEGSEERGRGKGPGVLRDGDDPQQRATNDGEQEAHQKGAEGDLRAPKRYTQKVYLHRPIHFGVYNRLIETIIIIIITYLYCAMRHSEPRVALCKKLRNRARISSTVTKTHLI